ncbi:hypothetical protein [Thalassotalea ganghwensis]
MQKGYIQSLFALVISITIIGCGSTPQPPVSLKTNMFDGKQPKIGVLYSPPKQTATTHIYGASCLLCYGVASALTSSLDKHLKSEVGNGELVTIKELVLNEYKDKSTEVKYVSLPIPLKDLGDFKGELGFAKKDFRSLKQTLGVDVLVVVDIASHGASRSFNGYIPTGDPKGYVSGLLYSVDLDSNAYMHYMPINESVQPKGEWDEPPSFPSVTTSYYQAIENLKSAIKAAI